MKQPTRGPLSSKEFATSPSLMIRLTSGKTATKRSIECGSNSDKDSLLGPALPNVFTGRAFDRPRNKDVDPSGGHLDLVQWLDFIKSKFSNTGSLMKSDKNRWLSTVIDFLIKKCGPGLTNCHVLNPATNKFEIGVPEDLGDEFVAFYDSKQPRPRYLQDEDALYGLCEVLDKPRERKQRFL